MILTKLLAGKNRFAMGTHQCFIFGGHADHLRPLVLFYLHKWSTIQDMKEVLAVG